MNFVTQVTSGLAALAVGSTYYLMARQNEELNRQADVAEEKKEDYESMDKDKSETTEYLESDNLQAIDPSNEDNILCETKNSKVLIKERNESDNENNEGKQVETELETELNHHIDIERCNSTFENDLKDCHSASLSNMLDTVIIPKKSKEEEEYQKINDKEEEEKEFPIQQQLNITNISLQQNEQEFNKKYDNEEIDTDDIEQNSSDDGSYYYDKLINSFPEPSEPAPILLVDNNIVLESAGDYNILESSVSRIKSESNDSGISNKSMRMSDYVTNSYVGWPFTTFKAKHNSKVVIGIVFILWLFCALLSYIFLELLYYSFGMEKSQVSNYKILMDSKVGMQQGQENNMDTSPSVSKIGIQNGYAWHW